MNMSDSKGETSGAALLTNVGKMVYTARFWAYSFLPQRLASGIEGQNRLDWRALPGDCGSPLNEQTLKRVKKAVEEAKVAAA